VYLFLEPEIFLLPHLEDLTIRGCRLHDNDGDELVTSPHKRQTGLKKMALEEVHIHHQALQRFLEMPKAVTHLKLHHEADMRGFEGGEGEGRSENVEDYMSAIGLHKDSLEVLEVNGQFWPCWQDYPETIDVRGWTKLRVLKVQEHMDAEPTVHVLHDATLKYVAPSEPRQG